MTELANFTIDLEKEESSSEVSELDSEENGNNNNQFIDARMREEQHKLTKNRLMILVVFLGTFVILFLFLWLAESQFSSGVLRPRLFGEYCGSGLVSNITCAEGFVCDYLAEKCRVDPKLRIEINPYDNTYNYGNLSDYKGNITCISCLPCPPAHPPPIVHKAISYFDYNEIPSHFISFGPQGSFQGHRSISYGACKELCSRETKCQVLVYNGMAQICWLGSNYILPATLNNTYISAIKTYSDIHNI